MKATPRPWICHSGMVWKDGPEVYPKGDKDGIPICRMDREIGNGTMPTERDSNAHLIVTAVNAWDSEDDLMARILQLRHEAKK